MSSRSPIGRPILGRPRRSQTFGSPERREQSPAKTATGSPHHSQETSGSPVNKQQSPRRTASSSYYTQTSGSPIKREPSPTKTTGSPRRGPPRTPVNDDDVNSIPEVPRIPERFLPRPEDRVPEPVQEPVQSKESEEQQEQEEQAEGDDGDEGLGSGSSIGPHTRYLPNCSFGKPKAVQVVTNSMMQAYVAMRGNWFGKCDDDDPLFEWIQQREELSQSAQPKITQRRHISRMLLLIDNALDPGNLGGDTPRDSVFEVYRPDFQHIKPPQDVDLNMIASASNCPEFEYDKDSDDEEADLPSGRISPCTFLQWSKDCSRWDADVNVFKEDTTSYERMRPPTPPYPMPPKDRESCSIHNPSPEPQWDIETGEELTPAYRIPSSPSIIYSPPGVDFKGFRSLDFLMQYRRMVPLVERRLRRDTYGCPGSLPALSDKGKNRITHSEVEAAAQDLNGRPGPVVEAELQEQWVVVSRVEEAEKELRKHAEAQMAHVEKLQHEVRHMTRFLPALQMRREARDRRIQARREVVRAYAADQAVEAQARLEYAWRRLHSARKKVSENVLRIVALQNEMRELCGKVGVRDIDHAFAVLMGTEEIGDVDVDVDDFGAGDAADLTPTTATATPAVDVAHGGFDVTGPGFVYAYGGGGYGPGFGPGLVPGPIMGYQVGPNVGVGVGPGVVPGLHIDTGIQGSDEHMGPWSPSSLGRAEEEYDRFLAEMQMRNNETNETSNETSNESGSRRGDSRRGDDESGDSGVAGIRFPIYNSGHNFNIDTQYSPRPPEALKRAARR